MNTSVIEVTDVSKRFKEHLILDGVSLTVSTGQVIGISGHNGSGKSIFLRIVCGFLRPDRGQVTVWGQTVGREIEFPSKTGILIDGPGFVNHLSGFHNLKLLAMIRDEIDDEQIRHAMEVVGLNPDNALAVGKYSTGMQQRLGLAQALMERPNLLILDEPTRGVDRVGTAEVQSLIRRLADEGKTILLTSHSTQELNDVCHQVYELERGKLLPA
jgi:ABC-2 type transport system ATP-binding protein